MQQNKKKITNLLGNKLKLAFSLDPSAIGGMMEKLQPNIDQDWDDGTPA